MPIEKRPTLEHWAEIMEKAQPAEALGLLQLAIDQLENDPMWSAYVKKSQDILTKRHIKWEPDPSE
jgi:hypothetical protein